MECEIFYINKRKLWAIKAFDRAKNEMIVWVMGSRSEKTFKRLYDKVKHLENSTFYTDSWDDFFKVLPKDHHIVDKQHTVRIEQDNIIFVMT